MNTDKTNTGENTNSVETDNVKKQELEKGEAIEKLAEKLKTAKAGFCVAVDEPNENTICVQNVIFGQFHDLREAIIRTLEESPELVNVLKAAIVFHELKKMMK